MSALQGEFEICLVEMPRFNGGIREVQNLEADVYLQLAA